MSNVKCLQDFMAAKGDKRPIESIGEIELCDILCGFFIDLKKTDGSNYEASSIKGMLESFERYLKSKHYAVSITTGIAFLKLNTVLKTKLEILRCEGMGNMPHRAESLSDEDIEKLWQSGQLGPHNPETIINTLWWNNTIHFRIRCVQTHLNLTWGNVTLETDGNGNEYLMYCKQQTKTDKGDNPQMMQDVKLKVWATGDARCPVDLYKRYSKLRPPDYTGPETPFYLATYTKGALETFTSFKRQPIGKNKLYSIMKRISKNAKLPSNKNFTNLSARKYLFHKFLD